MKTISESIQEMGNPFTYAEKLIALDTKSKSSGTENRLEGGGEEDGICGQNPSPS